MPLLHIHHVYIKWLMNTKMPLLRLHPVWLGSMLTPTLLPVCTYNLMTLIYCHVNLFEFTLRHVSYTITSLDEGVRAISNVAFEPREQGSICALIVRWLAVYVCS